MSHLVNPSPRIGPNARAVGAFACGFVAATWWTFVQKGRVHPLLDACVYVVCAIAGGVLIFSAIRLGIELTLAQKRAKQGLCAACGYDLRATRKRCPECGYLPSPVNII